VKNRVWAIWILTVSMGFLGGVIVTELVTQNAINDAKSAMTSLETADDQLKAADDQLRSAFDQQQKTVALLEETNDRLLADFAVLKAQAQAQSNGGALVDEILKLAGGAR
jgi:hypothetical protein